MKKLLFMQDIPQDHDKRTNLSKGRYQTANGMQKLTI